ncbi:MAG TPA: DNA alkylation repair protein, partial [Candidatus Omnitrophota bacterium]|nr:DNA alkylation repair protein [Candidatus Omnitrophota bacterium]
MGKLKTVTAIDSIKSEVRRQADPKKAIVLKRFFKTGPGEYGEGDIFLGLVVPKIRAIAKRYRDIGMEDVSKLVTSPIHEERLLGLLVLVSKFDGGDNGARRDIY